MEMPSTKRQGYTNDKREYIIQPKIESFSNSRKQKDESCIADGYFEVFNID